MTSQKRGLRYEHNIKNDINENTDKEIRCHRPGWSGNGGRQNDASHQGECDIILRTPVTDHALELKKTTKVLTESNPKPDTFTIQSDNITELVNCTNSYTDIEVVVKFSRRKPMVAAIDDLDNPSQSLVDNIPSEFAPRTGRAENDSGHVNVIIEDPWSLGYKDVWPSATASDDDYKVILDALDISDEYIMGDDTATFDTDVGTATSD